MRAVPAPPRNRAEVTTTDRDRPSAAIAMVDVEEEPPTTADLAAESSDLWVFLRRHEQPRTLVELDLTRPEDAERRYREALDRVRRAPVAEPAWRHVPDERQPSISVVIPTVARRGDDLDACLTAVLACDHPRFEVVLVDNRPTTPADDPLPELLARHPAVRSVRATTPGISSARTAGIAAADGEIVAFTDDDVRVDPRWLRALGARFAERPDESLVTGLSLPLELETAAQVWMEHYYGGFGGDREFEPLSYGLEHPEARAPRRAGVVAVDAFGHTVRRMSVYQAGTQGGGGCNLALRRGPWSRARRFDPRLGTGTPARGGEDIAAIVGTLWDGERVGYEPAAVIRHRHRRTPAELREQIEWYGVGFTAMLTSLVVTDPGHAVAVAAQVPRMGGRLLALAARRAAGRRHVGPSASGEATGEAPERSFPGDLARREWAGYARGPLAYHRSRRHLGRQPAHGTGEPA